MRRVSGEWVDRSSRSRRSGLARWLVLALLATGPGCIGPRSLELTRLRYDQAVHETGEQEWLRNIVRLRYGDLPSLMDVAAITSQFEASGGGSYTTGLERASPNVSNFGNASFQLRDAPTLSYTPRDPTELTRTMVAPVGITALGLMANNGWSLVDVLRLMVAEVNGLENAPGAEELIPQAVPPPSPFLEVTQLAGRLRRDRAVALASVEDTKPVSSPIEASRVDGSDLVEAATNKLEYRPGDAAGSLILTRKDPGYSLTFSTAPPNPSEADEFRRLLRLTPGRRDYRLKRLEAPGHGEVYPLADSLDAIEIRTRTLLDMLTFLSKGVRVPEDHLRRGLAAQTMGPDGAMFDWTEVTRGLFQVCVARKRPKEAAVAVEYQGFWYFIPAADKRSKATLGLIQALFNLQLSEPKKAGPLLTLPVGL